MFDRVKAVATAFGEDDCAFYAGAVAYQLFFAIIPLLALLIGVVGFVYGADRAARELAGVVRAVVPLASGQEVRILRDLADGRALSLGIGAIGTIFSASAIHGALDSALASVLGRTGRRGFVKGRLEAIAFVAGLVLLAVVSFAISYGVTALEGEMTALGYKESTRVVLQVLSPLLAALPAFAFFYLIYHAVPRAALGRRPAAIGALFATGLWELAKVLFGVYTRALGVFASFGPLAFAAGLLTWIYLTAVIILLGAEIAKTFRRQTT